MENIGVGLMLMVVGMATVFVILLIVIYLSKYLITVVNKVAPEETPKKAPAVAPTADTGAMDAIKAAVEILTAGKGQVIKIERMTGGYTLDNYYTLDGTGIDLKLG